MSTYVRLFYPDTTTTSSFQSNFIDFGNKYVYRNYYKNNGLVNICFGCEVISSDTIKPEINKIQISNNYNFLLYKEIDISSINKSINYWYSFLVDSISGSVTQDESGIVGETQPSNEYLEITTNEIEEIEENSSYQKGLICLRGWPLSSNEGNKTVFIRFVLSNSTYYPEETNTISKGFYDSIIWQKSLPSIPGRPIAINSTENDYVGNEIFWTFNKSQDVISNIDGYSINLKQYGDETYSNQFENKQDIIENSENLISFEEAEQKKDNGKIVFLSRYENTDCEISEITSPFTGVEIETIDDGTSVWKGFEISSYTGVVGKNASAKIKYDFNTSEEIENYDPESPPTKDQQYFFTIKNFRDTYTSIYSGASLFFDVFVDNEDEYGYIHTSGCLYFDTQVYSYSSSGCLYFETPVVTSSSYITQPLFVDPNNIESNIDTNVQGNISNKSYVMVSISKQNIIKINTNNWGDDQYESIYEVDEIPTNGTIYIEYEHSDDIYNMQVPENTFYISDTDDFVQKIITQTFCVSKIIPDINKIKLKLKNIGNNTQSTDKISATIVECNNDGTPINTMMEPNSYYWNDVDSASGIIFNDTVLSFKNQEFEASLSTTSSDLTLYPSKQYLLILAIQSDNNGDSKLTTKIYQGTLDNSRHLYEAIYIENNFSNDNWNNGGMKILKVNRQAVNNNNKIVVFDLLDNSDLILFSNYNNNNSAQISVYFSKENEFESELLVTAEIQPLLGNYRSVVYGHRHIETTTSTISQIDSIEINDCKLFSNIIVPKPNDMSSGELVVGNSVFSGVPNIIGNSNWKNYETATKSDNLPEDNTTTASYRYSNVVFVDGGSTTKAQVKFDVSLFSSDNSNPNGGGQPDYILPGVIAWVGKDIYYSEPCFDDSIQIDSEYYFYNIKNYTEGEIYYFISIQPLYNNIPDVYRNYVNNIGYPTDYIRIAITQQGDVKLYRPNSNTEETGYVIVKNIEKVIEEKLSILGLSSDPNTYHSERGRIIINIDNESKFNSTLINIYFSVITSSGLKNIQVAKDIIEERLTPQNNLGFYVAIGSRIKYSDREHSAFCISNLSVIPENKDAISWNEEPNLFLYNETNGIELDDRSTLYPDITIETNDGDYYLNENHKYIKGNNDINSKKYLLSSVNGYTAGYNEINWCDQVLNNPNKIKCWGVVVSNASDNRRDLGEPQKCVKSSISSGLTGRDSLPPLGDRRAYYGNSAISRSETKNKILHLLVNSRNFSQNEWICSEWQWYEAISPWSSDTEWIAVDASDAPANRRSSCPKDVDKLNKTNYSVVFDYDLSFESNDCDSEIYFGLSNFKPAYRAYNNSSKNLSLSVKGVNITDGGSGYVLPPSVEFAPNPLDKSKWALATAIIEGGSVKSVIMLSEGADYSENTEVIFADGTFSSNFGRAATGKPVLKTPDGSSSENVRYSIEKTEGKWIYSVHDYPGPVSGNMAHDHYDPSLVSVAFAYGEGFSYSNSSEISGIRGLFGQSYREDKEAASYHILLPYKKISSAAAAIRTISPIDIERRAFFFVSISKDGKIKITKVKTRKSWSNNTDENDKLISDIEIDFPKYGRLELEVKRGIFKIENGIDANTFTLVKDYTPTSVIDCLTIYHGEGFDKIKLLQIFVNSMENIEYFNYLYPFFGIREKSNSGISENIIGNTIISTTDAKEIIPVQPNEVSWWIKKQGSLEDEDFAYGRYCVIGQTYDDSNRIKIDLNNPHIAQSFILSQENESIDNNILCVPWENKIKISCIDLKIEPTNNCYDWRCLIVGNYVNSPNIGKSGETIGINDIYEEEFSRPTTDINVYSSDVIGVGYGKQSLSSDIVKIFFEPYIELDTETTYWIVLTNPKVSLSYNSLCSSEYSEVYIWQSYQDYEYVQNIKCGASFSDAQNKIVPNNTAKVWNVFSKRWEDANYNIYFKIYKKYFINKNNELNNEEYSLSAASISKSGLTSNYSRESKIIKVDIVAPWDSISNSNTPYIEKENTDNEIIKKYNINIYADDTDDGNGSGIWRFRIGYYDDYGSQKFNPWVNWLDSDGDDKVTYSIIFSGNYISSKNVFVQIQDKVGNISESNLISIDSEYGFIIDTQPPYLTAINIEGEISTEQEEIDPEFIETQNANVSTYAVDATTEVKDFRINLNYEKNGDGSLVYSNYFPMVPSYVQDLGSEDGIKFVTVQFRDYANNADQAEYKQIITKNFIDISELPTVHQKYNVSGKEYLYLLTSANIERNNLIGVYKSLSGYDIYTVYYFINNSNIIQKFNRNEQISVYVNDQLKEEDIDYTINYSKGYIIFNESLTIDDEVEINTIEIVSKLYRFNGSVFDLIYKFTDESEKLATAIIVYNNKLYIGFHSGNIYSYNGSKIEKEYTLTPNVPVSCMAIARFDFETRDYLYVGSYFTPKIWRYGGNNTVENYSWKELDTINNFSKIINGSEFAFSEQNDIYSLEFYKNKLFIATGNNSAIFNYNRELDEDGITIIENIDVNLLSETTTDFCGTKVTTLKTFNEKIFAGTDSNAIFYYQQMQIKQPNDSNWNQTTDFNSDFINDSKPFVFYESEGRTSIGLSNSIKIITDSNLNETMQIKSDISEIVTFIDNSESAWIANVLNATGWTVEFELQVNKNDNSIYYGKQGIDFFDDKYQFKFRIDNTKIYLNNYSEIYEILLSDISGNTKVEKYSYEENFINETSINKYIYIYDMDYVVNNNILNLKVKENSNYPYINILNISDIYANSDTYFEIRFKAKSFEADSTNIYIQWSNRTDGPFVKEKTYTISLNNNNIWKDLSFNPGWTGDIKSMRIIIEPTELAEIDIDYIRIRNSSISSFNVYDMNKYRICVHDTNVKLYINDSNDEIVNLDSWLTKQSFNKSLIFGKIEQNERYSDFYWKTLKIYCNGAISPLSEQQIYWNLLNRFNNGAVIHSLNNINNKLIAIVNPNSSILETDDASEYVPRTYIMEDNITWEEDTEYNIIYKNVIYSSEFNNSLISTVHNNDENTTTLDILDIISNMIRNDIDYIPLNGNVLTKKLTHAWDSVIKDTSPPETNIVIKENEDAKGIDVYELNVYTGDL